jgi:hypothetical protein
MNGESYLKETPLLAGRFELGCLLFPGLWVEESSKVNHRKVAGVLVEDCILVDVRLRDGLYN